MADSRPKTAPSDKSPGRFHKLFHALVQAGVRPEDPPSRRIALADFGTVLALAIPSVLTYAPIALVYQQRIGLLVCLLTGSLYGFSAWLKFRFHDLLARHLFLVAANLSFLSGTLVAGKAGEVQLLFVVSITLAYYIFEAREWRSMLVQTILPTALWTFLEFAPASVYERSLRDLPAWISVIPLLQVPMLISVLLSRHQKLLDKALDEAKVRESELALSNKMAALGEMADGISHEINNPLAVLEMRVHMITTMLQRGTPDNIQLAIELDKIRASVTRISSIVRGLRMFSRPAEQDPMERYTLKRILWEAKSVFTERYRTALIDLRAPSPPQLELECRLAEILQAIYHLMNNAHDAVVRTPDAWVSVEFVPSADGQRVQIRVSDSGPGVPEEVVRHLTEAFFTTKTLGQGTGLGLNISRNIVERYGGTLFLDRQARHTCFVLELPLTQSESAPRPEPKTEAPAA